MAAVGVNAVLSRRLGADISFPRADMFYFTSPCTGKDSQLLPILNFKITIILAAKANTPSGRARLSPARRCSGPVIVSGHCA